MLAVNYTTMRNNLKEYCDKATDNGETIISLEQYNKMEKELRNAKYLAKIDRAFDQLYSGKGQVHELIED